MTIVVGVDGSGPSRAALTWAAKRAADRGEALRLVHVVDEDWGQMGQDVATQESDHGQAVLAEAESLAHDLAPSVPIETRLVHGSTAWELATSADSDDLLVVGTHKTGYLSGRALGTRSIVVASIAKCSVAVIPDAPTTGRRGVVVGVAGSAWSTAVAWAADEAARRGDDVTLVHCTPHEEGRDVLARAAATASYPGSLVRSRVSRRRPSEALLDASRSAGMLVLGHTRVPADRGNFLGSTTHEVLLNINSPVIIAHP